VGALELPVAVVVPDGDVGVAVDETGTADDEPFAGFVAAAAVAAPTATATTTTATTAHRITDDARVSQWPLTVETSVDLGADGAVHRTGAQPIRVPAGCGC